MPLTKQQHLDPNHGPKRILSLDGGGIRGILTLEYLAVIEAMLRQRFKDPNLAPLRLFRPHRRHVDRIDHRGGSRLRHVGRRVEGTLLEHRRERLPARARHKVAPGGASGKARPQVSVRAAPAGTGQAARRGHDARQRHDPHRPHDHDQAARHGQSLAVEQRRAGEIRRPGWRPSSDADRPGEHGRADLLRS